MDIGPRAGPRSSRYIMEHLLVWYLAVGAALANPVHLRSDLRSRQVDGAVSESVFLRRAYHSCQYPYLGTQIKFFTLTPY